MPAERSEAHLAGCSACQDWLDRSAALTRTLRVRPAAPTRDFTDIVLSAAPPPSVRGWWPRAALGVVAIAQLALGVAQVFGADQAMPGMPGMTMSSHLFNESTAWNLALGLGMLWAALRTRATTGMLPVMAGFLIVLTAFSVHDMIVGEVRLARVALHGLLLIGLGLLYVVHRTSSQRRTPTPEHPDSLPVPHHATTTSGLIAARRTGETKPRGGPLRPTGRHHAA